jgi:hypothetical protein
MEAAHSYQNIGELVLDRRQQSSTFRVAHISSLWDIRNIIKKTLCRKSPRRKEDNINVIEWA